MRIILALFLFINIAQAKFKWGYQLGAEQNMVLLFHFNEGEYSTTYDVSGQNNNGTITNALWVNNGYLDKCLDFDGNGDYVQSTDIDIAGSLTIYVWFKLTVPLANQLSDYPFLLEKGYAGWNERNYGIYFSRNNDYLSASGVLPDQSSNVFGLTFNSVSEYVDDLEWHNVIVIWNRATLKAYMLFDGEVVVTDDGVDSDLYNNNYDLAIGCPSNTTYRYIKAQIDEVAIWDRALSVAEAKFLYQSQCGRYK